MNIHCQAIIVHLIYSLSGCSPVIVHPPESRNVNLGDKTVIFECEAQGTPPLQYCWKFSGRVLATEKTVTIKNIDRKDEGTYQCYVENKYHCVTSSAELKIGRCTSVFILDFVCAFRLITNGSRLTPTNNFSCIMSNQVFINYFQLRSMHCIHLY